jgi:hypothetical protein
LQALSSIDCHYDCEGRHRAEHARLQRAEHARLQRAEHATHNMKQCDALHCIAYRQYLREVIAPNMERDERANEVLLHERGRLLAHLHQSQSARILNAIQHVGNPDAACVATCRGTGRQAAMQRRRCRMRKERLHAAIVSVAP